MGMFNKKKANLSPDFSQEVPDFRPVSEEGGAKLPKLPKSNEGKEMFPSYQSEFSNIKKEIAKPTFTAPKQATDISVTPKPIPIAPKVEIPAVSVAQGVAVERVVVGDKPIYVKMDQYKDAMHNIDKIKELCNEADRMLSEISKLRASEDKELEQWQGEVDKIKDKILLVDKKLFEI
jgi:hypothetical protein